MAEITTFRGMASKFRSVGSAATPQWLMQIQNAAGTVVLVSVRSFMITFDHSGAVASTVANGSIGLSRSTGTRAGGTVCTKVSAGLGPDAAQTSDANVTIAGDASADGTNTLITGLTAGAWMNRRFANRMHTLAGQALSPPVELIPQPLLSRGIILRSGEQLAATIVFAAAADNLAGFGYTASILWDEFTP